MDLPRHQSRSSFKTSGDGVYFKYVSNRPKSLEYERNTFMTFNNYL